MDGFDLDGHRHVLLPPRRPDSSPVRQPHSTTTRPSYRYLWDPAAVDQLLADEKVTSATQPGSILSPLADHLGTLRDFATYHAGTNTTTIANHRRYDSYGYLISETSAAGVQIFGYTGRPFDEATGLQTTSTGGTTH